MSECQFSVTILRSANILSWHIGPKPLSMLSVHAAMLTVRRHVLERSTIRNNGRTGVRTLYDEPCQGHLDTGLPLVKKQSLNIRDVRGEPGSAICQSVGQINLASQSLGKSQSLS